MAVCWRPFIAALLLFAVMGLPVEGCDDTLATVDCSTDYANSITNLTNAQLMDKTVQCGLVTTMKSCFVAACGSWETVPEQFKTVVQDAETNLKCGSPDQSCQNPMATLDCITQLQAAMNTSDNIYANHDRACQVMNQFKTCVVTACGGLDRVPQEVLAALDAGKQHGLDCESGSSALMVAGHTAAVWMLTILSLSVWMA